MKRLITLALIFALLLSLLGCQEVKNDSGESSFDKSNNLNKNYVFDYDFHLTEESKARGIASDVFLDVLPYDLDGVVREQSGVDAGCYVYKPTDDSDN